MTQLDALAANVGLAETSHEALDLILVLAAKGTVVLNARLKIVGHAVLLGLGVATAARSLPVLPNSTPSAPICQRDGLSLLDADVSYGCPESLAAEGIN